MTPPFLLEVRAEQTNAAREVLARSQPWQITPEEDRQAALTWFGSDATDKLTSALWEIHGFIWAFGALRTPRGPLRREAVTTFNRTAKAVKATAEAALRYAESYLDLFARAEQVSPQVLPPGFETLLAPLREWFEKCQAAYTAAFEHWVPLRVPTKDEIDTWAAAGDLIPVEDCLREAEARLTPEVRDGLRRRVAAGG